MNINVKVKRLDNDLDFPMPTRATNGSAGYDLRCCLPYGKSILVPARGSVVIDTGFAFEIPEGYEMSVRPRSGLARKHKITVLNSPATIDSDYRGMVSVLLVNHGYENYYVKHGDRIAQAVFHPVLNVTFEEVYELNDTERGEGGFGHTGN